ncbi:hypothetical protein DL96DRAFT_1688225 [Flagelloscypha sp. PMI_526]|nr:hypothetical protein DL96DRAFT_1688225 [Flagelloscypha sp. PMI_526]
MEYSVATALNVERLAQNGPIKTTIIADLPLDMPFADLAHLIQPLMEPAPFALAPEANICSNSEVRSNLGRAVKKGCHVVHWQDHSISVGPAQFKFNRTLRVPDDATSYALPPVRAPPHIFPADRVLVLSMTDQPLFQREAMWIGTCAIKVSGGGINAITGSKQDEDPPNGLQDYLVGGKQPWLDGIATEPGVFVAMRLGHGYTIEEQLSDTASGGIQIDVFPSLLDVVTFHQNGDEVPLAESPRSLNIPPGRELLMKSTHPGKRNLWKGYAMLFPLPRPIPFLTFLIANIRQIITGIVCPLTPITPDLYKAHDYPWFALYDEHLPTVHPSGFFENVKSILERDYVASLEQINPEYPPDCACYLGRTSTCIARPCGHPACVECFGAAIFSGWKCPECSSKIAEHVGFERPVPRVANNDDNNKGIWWEAEKQIQGVSIGTGNVTTLMLEQDRVSRLHGSNSPGQ